MTRHERIRQRLARFTELGVIRPDSYTYRPGDGRVRWNVVPAGFTERSFLTSEVEDFILGADAALNARRRGVR